jgi:hypothetical protein
MMKKFIDKLSITNTFILGVLVIVVLAWVLNAPTKLEGDQGPAIDSSVLASEAYLEAEKENILNKSQELLEAEKGREEVLNASLAYKEANEKRSEPKDVIPPLLINISVTDITADKATIIWETKELATGKIYYSSKTPMNFKAVATIKSTIPKENHSFTIQGLLPKTRYYYVLESIDVSGNKGTSIESSFETLEAVN